MTIHEFSRDVMPVNRVGSLKEDLQNILIHRELNQVEKTACEWVVTFLSEEPKDQEAVQNQKIVQEIMSTAIKIAGIKSVTDGAQSFDAAVVIAKTITVYELIQGTQQPS